MRGGEGDCKERCTGRGIRKERTLVFLHPVKHGGYIRAKHILLSQNKC